MVALHLSCNQAWIHIRSSAADHSNQIRSNVCDDWNVLTISVDSVCHLVHAWLTQTDTSKFEMVEYEFKPVNWRIEHTASESDDTDKGEHESNIAFDKKTEEEVNADKARAPELSNNEGKELNADQEATRAPIPESNVESKRFLIGVLISQAQLFDLICAFLEDAYIQTLPYTASVPITKKNTKLFYLTREVQVVCLASDSVNEWYIMNNDEPVWKTCDDVIAAALLDLIYQRGNVELITWQNQPLKRYPKVLNKNWGEIAIGPEMLRHYAETGKFGLHGLPEGENNFVNHSLSHLRTEKAKYDPGDF
jgi:hypothetical protein